MIFFSFASENGSLHTKEEGIRDTYRGKQIAQVMTMAMACLVLYLEDPVREMKHVSCKPRGEGI